MTKPCSQMFDFVLAFGATSLWTKDLKRCISKIVKRIGIDKTANIWETVSQVIAHDRVLLQATDVVLIYREREAPQTVSRRIGAHYPPLRPWGFQFEGCATKGCSPRTSELTVKNSHGKIQIVCQLCLWKSAWVGEHDVKEYFTRASSKAPNVYWHNFPASQELKRLFIRITSERAK